MSENRPDEQCHGCWGPTKGVIATVPVLGISLRFCGNCLYEAFERFGPFTPVFVGRYADFNESTWRTEPHRVETDRRRRKNRAGSWRRPLMIGR